MQTNFEKSTTKDLMLLVISIKFSIELNEYKLEDKKTEELKNSIQEIEKFGKSRNINEFTKGLEVSHPGWLDQLEFELSGEPVRNQLRMQAVKIEKEYHTMLTNFVKLWEETVSPVPA